MKKHLTPDVCYITLTAFPRLGAKEVSSFYHVPTPCDEIQRSQFLSDDISSPHARYRALNANIRSRRGRKVEINIPVYRDEKTPWPFHDPMGPILLALTAATPIAKGLLTDTDVRWNMIAAALDDRTQEESGDRVRWKSDLARY